MSVTYRKTKKGEWVVMGPSSVVRPGATVTVTKKGGGTKAETVESVGKTFMSGGREMVYGYLRPQSSGGYRETGYRRVERDHEDCLSLGPCGSNCEYAYIFGGFRG